MMLTILIKMSKVFYLYTQDMHNREIERLLAVERFLKLEISRADELKEIVKFAAKICGTPIALITLLDENTQHLKVSFGIDDKQTNRKHAFCNHVIEQESIMVIPDTAKDNRFANNPLRKNKLNIQFYAGAPLITHDGLKLGSLCVIGHEPQDLDENQMIMLESLSRQVIHILEFDYSLQIMKEQYLEAKKNENTLRSLFETSTSCLLFVDLDLRIRFFNKVMKEFMKVHYGITMRTGIPIMELEVEILREEFINCHKKALSGERVVTERVVEYPDKQLWWELSFGPAYDEQGEIAGLSFCATDITEAKQSKINILEKDQSLHAIALIQSHEIRGPVASILGLTELFRLNDYQAEKEEIIMLERAVKELDGKIHTIVDYAYGK